MADFKAKLGTKVAESTVDKQKSQKLQATPKQGTDVEGQVRYLDLQICPHCGAVGYGVEDSDIYMWFQCHNCGRWFKA